MVPIMSDLNTQDVANWSPEQIRGLAQRFLNANAPESVDLDSLGEVTHWRPIYMFTTASGTAEYSYQSGYTDERFQAAKRRYAQERLAYNAAYNQYVNALNQFNQISKSEENLPSHKRTHLFYPQQPREPVAPNPNDYVVWAERKHGRLNSSQTINNWHPEPEPLERMLAVLKNESHNVSWLGGGKKMTFDSHLVHEHMQATSLHEAGVDASRQQARAKHAIENQAQSIAEGALQEVYHRDIKIEKLEVKSMQTVVYKGYFLLLPYEHEGQKLHVIIDPARQLIGAEWPSALKRWGRYAVVIVLTFVFSFLFSNALLFKEDFELRLLYTITLFLGLNILAQCVELSQIRPAFFRKTLTQLSWSHWGFRKTHTVDVRLSSYT